MARRNNVDQLAQAFTTNPLDAAAYDDRDTSETDALFSALSQVKNGHIPTNAIIPRDSGVMEIAGWKITPVGLVPPSDVTEAQYQNVGRALLRLDTSMQWLIGDWVVLGDNFKWGETYQILADEFGYEPKTLREYAYVARNVPASIRMDGLSFGHHQVVTAMNENEQRHWLEKAATDGLSIAKLRSAIKTAQLPPPSETPTRPTEPLIGLVNRVKIAAGRYDNGAGHRGVMIARDLYEAGLWDGEGEIWFFYVYEMHTALSLDKVKLTELSITKNGLGTYITMPAAAPTSPTVEPGAVVQTRTGHYGTVENVSGQVATVRTPNGASKHKLKDLSPVEELDIDGTDTHTTEPAPGFDYTAYNRASESWRGARQALEEVRVIHISGLTHEGTRLSRSNRDKARQKIRDLIAHLNYIESQLD